MDQSTLRNKSINTDSMTIIENAENEEINDNMRAQEDKIDLNKNSND